MRRLLACLGLLTALSGTARGADDGPRIVGPSTVPAGYAVVLTLEGLPRPVTFEEFLTRAELLQDWRVYPRGPQPGFGPPRVIVGALSVVLVFEPATAPGKYWIVGHVPHAIGVDTIVEHELTVEGSPNPPPPPPPPPPPAEVAVVIVRETDDSTGEQAILLQKLRPWLWAEKLKHEIVDDDQLFPSGKRPPWLEAVLASAREANVSLPVLAVCAADYSRVVHVDRLPETAEQAIAVIRKYGGR